MEDCCLLHWKKQMLPGLNNVQAPTAFAPWSYFIDVELKNRLS
jgi:hypothetical protein